MQIQNQDNNFINFLNQRISENIEIKNTLEKLLFLNEKQFNLLQLHRLEEIKWTRQKIGIKIWKSLRGAHEIEISAEAQGMFAPNQAHVIYPLEAILTVEVWIATVNPSGKGVSNFQMRFRADGRKIKAAAGKLNAQFVQEGGRKIRVQAHHQRLIAEEVVPESGGGVETIV